LAFNFSCKGQKGFGSEQLVLKQSIPLHDVSGRIDHMDVNLKLQVVYFAALGNNSVEIVDLKNGKAIGSIKELNEPQGVAYIPQTNEVVVSNGGNGNCNFYNANSFIKTASVVLGSDADDVRYDSTGEKIYIGYGDGGIVVIDAVNHQIVANIKLPAHPEGFQLDRQAGKVFVNVPDSKQIDVIDLKTHSLVDKWKTKYGANFPMAIDENHHILFIGYRHPGKLVAMRASDGKIVCEVNLVQDVDDLYFDEHTNKVYASGGGGSVNVFSFDRSKFKQVANIPTRSGARTSLLIPSFNLFILAERTGGGKEVQLDIFSTTK